MKPGGFHYRPVITAFYPEQVAAEESIITKALLQAASFAAFGRAFCRWLADESRIPDGYSVVTFQP